MTQPSTVPIPPVLDHSVLAAVAAVGGDDDKTFLPHIIEIYCRDMSTSLQNMHIALQQHNQDTVRKLAHKMKSSSANLGARRLTIINARIEKGELAVTPELFKKLQSEFQKVVRELNAAGGEAL